MEKPFPISDAIEDAGKEAIEIIEGNVDTITLDKLARTRTEVRKNDRISLSVLLTPTIRRTRTPN